MKKKKQQYKPERIDNAYMFDSLMSGMSWDQAQESYREQKDQVPQKEPTEKEILADWIISKDQQQNQFACGGKKYQDGSYLDFGKYIDWNTIRGTQQSLPQLAPLQYGNLANTTLSPEIKQNVSWGATDDLSRQAVRDNMTEKAAPWINGIAAVGQVALDKIGDYNRLDDYVQNANAQIGQLDSWKPAFGNTTQAFNQMNNLPQWESKSKEDMGWKNGWQVGSSALANGLAAGLSTMNIFAGLGAAAASLAGDLVGNSEAKSNTELVNLGGGLAGARNIVESQYELGNMNKRINKANLQGYMKAEGGYMSSASDDYNKQLTKFNTGGDHEENPNGGIQQGINPQDGMPNLVEQGETKWNDYIFSKRIYADGGTLKANHINDKKYNGWSYSDISKDLFKEYEERPNDSIARRTWEDFAQKLQMAQEADKLKLKQKKVGGFINSLDEDQFNALQDQMMFEHEQEAEAEAQAQAQHEQEIAAQDQAYQEQLYDQAAQEGLVGSDGVYANGGHAYAYGNPPYSKRIEGKKTNNSIGPNYPEVKTMTPRLFDDGVFQVDPEGFSEYLENNLPDMQYSQFSVDENTGHITAPSRHLDDPWVFRNVGGNNWMIVRNTPNDSVEETAVARERISPRMDYQYGQQTTLNGPYMNTESRLPNDVNIHWTLPIDNSGSDTSNPSKTVRTGTKSYSKNNIPSQNKYAPVSPVIQGLVDIPLLDEDITEDETDALVSKVSQDRKQQQGSSDSVTTDAGTAKSRLPLLRFAPVLGSGINYFKDLIGIQNRNDYSDADMAQREADRLNPIIAPYIGGYQQFAPIDEAYLQNKAASQAAATARQIANASNGNRGYVSVNNAINSYNMNNAIGDLGINAARANQAQRLAVAQFNNRINEINASHTMSAEEKNAAIQEAKARLYSNIAQMRTTERYANDAAKAANENAFWANFGAIGKEASAFKMLDANRALLYGYNPLTLDSFYKYLMEQREEEEKKNR